jgi:hypothetical protein
LWEKREAGIEEQGEKKGGAWTREEKARNRIGTTCTRVTNKINTNAIL